MIQLEKFRIVDEIVGKFSVSAKGSSNKEKLP